MSQRVIIKTLTAGSAAALCFMAGISAQEQPPDFTRDVQPVLQQSCYQCHGPKLQMGGLRLDSKSLAAKSIVPGKSGESSLYLRIAGHGDQARMPMGGKPLPPEQIAKIKQWIDAGAVWPESASAQTAEIKKHWAYIAPQRPSVPPGVNAIDYFIRKKLKEEGLTPAPEADRVTLLRRLSLDLTGLPPAIEEIDAFLADKSPKAYEKQVDRLLASPHYGERWARHWLDAARYADSDGFEKDKQRSVWFYRDYVINALNRDLPYDRFIIEQIAGDLLPNATQDQIVATGFLRNSMINEEGGIDPEQFRMEAMFDRIDAVGKAVLGLTIQCAQCHNHKFDPLTQEEYYRIFAFLNNSHEANAAVYTPAEQQKRAEIFRRIQEIEAGLKHRTPDWQAKMMRWANQLKASQPEWTVLNPEVDDISNGGQKYLPMKDGSMLAAGYAPTKHKVKMTVKTSLDTITAFRLQLLNDPNLPLGGPGRSIRGTGALTEFEVEKPAASSSDKATPVKIARALADVDLPERPLDPMFDDKTNRPRVTGPVSFAIDGKEETAWSHDAGPVLRNLPRNAIFLPAEPLKNPGGASLTIYLNQRHGGWNSDDNQNNNLGRMRISVTSSPNITSIMPEELGQVLEIPEDKRTPAHMAVIFKHWRATVPEWKQANEEIEKLWRQHPEGSSQLVLRDREEMRPTHILSRGDFLKPGKVVEGGTPAFLHPFPKDAPRNRLGFARWLVDRGSPTTARSIVNRIWQTYFGTGLVSTSEDLGKQSEPPSHPELLDWLAVELMDRGWSLKTMHREIVTSATYRQTSRVTPELSSRDPYNRLLARGPRFRVEGEIVRDIALAASGLLNPKVGGASVYPPAPDFLFQPPVSYGPKIWKEEKDDERYRRALYTFRYRSVPYPVLQNFDTPNGDMSCVRRARSNTPLQALTTLNEPLFIEAAQALARQTLEHGGSSDPQRLDYAFRRCVSRKPTPAESSALLELLARQRSRMAEGWIDVWGLAGMDPGHQPKLPQGATPAQLAGWTAVSRVLLNLDETITKE